MFYIKKFFKISSHYPFKSALFCLMTVILTMTFLHGNSFRVWFWDYYGKLPFYPSFYALYTTSENSDYIKSKLLALPDIEKVEFKNRYEIKNEVADNFSEMGLTTDLVDFDYSILRIYLDKRTSEKTFNLLKEYLQRLVKDKNIIFTKISNEKDLEITYKNDFMDVLKKMGMTPLYVVSFLFWFLAFFIWIPDVKKFSYILENYQRRSFVFSKIFITGTALITLIVLIPSLLLMGSFHHNYLLIIGFYLIMGFLMNRIKYEFSEKS